MNPDWSMQCWRCILIIVILVLIAGCNKEISKEQNETTLAYSKEQTSIKHAFAFKYIQSSQEVILQSLDSNLILKKLYDNPKIDTNGVAIWLPDYYERRKVPVSYDGKCHTKIDSIMYFTDSRNRKCAVVILANYQYAYVKPKKGEPREEYLAGSHFTGLSLGIALFSKNEDRTWKLYAFETAFACLGYFGTYKTGKADAGEISLLQIGDSWTCLSLKQGVGGNTGVLSGCVSLFSIEEYGLSKQDYFSEGWSIDKVPNNIFCYNYSESVSIPNTIENYYDTTILRMIKKPKDYYDINLISTRNGVVSIRKYKYCEGYLNKYIQIN